MSEDRRIPVEPITADLFAPFGDLLMAEGAPTKLINQGACGRYHDLARMTFDGGEAGISFFKSDVRHLPLILEMVERHPEGSQAFLPMSEHPFLVVVAPDAGGVPGRPRAFLTGPGQGVNYHRGTWHGVLTPLHAPGLFAVIDRIGQGANLEEYHLPNPVHVVG